MSLEKIKQIPHIKYCHSKILNIKPYKMANRSKDKEASIYASRLNASYTLEAAVVLPVFITLMVFGIFLFRILEVQAGVQQGMDMASRTMAVVSFSDDDSESEKSDTAILASTIAYAELLNKQNNIPTSYIYGGLLGLNYGSSTVEGNYIDLKVNYKMRFPVGLLGRFTFDISQTAKCRKWVGYDPSENSIDGEYVYVTAYGTVYHRDYNCSYLNPSVRAVSASSVSSLRNSSGGKYYPCSDCNAGKDSGTVYITDYGTVYHSKSNCSAIKRSIRRVLLEKVKDTMGCCSKCGG